MIIDYTISQVYSYRLYDWSNTHYKMQ